jgi:hypothetical protein
MATSKPTVERHDFEVDEFNAMIARPTKEKFVHRDVGVTWQCHLLTVPSP